MVKYKIETENKKSKTGELDPVRSSQVNLVVYPQRMGSERDLWNGRQSFFNITFSRFFGEQTDLLRDGLNSEYEVTKQKGNFNIVLLFH